MVLYIDSLGKLFAICCHKSSVESEDAAVSQADILYCIQVDAQRRVLQVVEGDHAVLFLDVKERLFKWESEGLDSGLTPSAISPVISRKPLHLATMQL